MSWAGDNLTLTPAQRRVLIVLVGAGALYCGVLAMRRTMAVPEIQPESNPRATELADRIDPNQADWAALAVLPSIGEKRARDIIAKREMIAARDGDPRPFKRVEDLGQVEGIGPATLTKLRPYLYFPTTRPVE